ncbi:SMI1/KNR4 family protein [Blastopirellula marina]|uniref:Knr4/Smi1-like domain-containing protein n=1 Tax=Blastopirellula marina TaxID=124 RepID=A0A2S8FU63_9BACT|nr:SMI1/KNR4 family protein [Blastopirellula marina]PQO35600.1 hypothetical protein C5Y98_13230 [Blastopirellula marina]PTL44240.1 hypothetical protein C5Y97_13240 [Blastopirellula marina]
MPSHTDMPERVKRVLEKLTRRGAQLGSVLSEREIESFEEEHHVTLPAAYREFLMFIGNGGDGPPYYGCARLGEAADCMSAHQQTLWTTLPDVATSFPFTKPWVWEEGDESVEGTDDQIHHGNIYIGNEGCGQYWLLIVTGPERGNLWQLCGEGIVPTNPRRDFLQWYEGWLDGVEDWWE